MKYCRECGKEIIEEAVICLYCECPTERYASVYEKDGTINRIEYI